MSSLRDRYLPPFSIVGRLMRRDTETGKFVLEPEALFLLLELAAHAAGFDEEWYCANNIDVESAKRAGEISDGLEHFARAGYFEGRLPSPLQVDETWYRAKYQDVATAIAEGKLASAQSHFAIAGYHEGRVAAATQQRDSERWRSAAEA